MARSSLKNFYLPFFFLMLFLLAALVLLSMRYYTDYSVRMAEKRNPPAGSFVEVAGMKLHYLAAGEGRPVVMIHGSFGSLYDYKLSVFDSLASQYRAVAFDRPGHGYSERPPGEMDVFDHARFLHAAVRRLGLEDPVIMGTSLGGAVALAYGLEYPEDVSALVLVNPYVTPYKWPPHPMHRIPAVPVIGDFFLDVLLNPIGNLQADKIFRKVFYPAEAPEEYVKTASSLALRPSHFRSNAEDIRALPDALREINGRLEELRVPAVFVISEVDLIAPPGRHGLRIQKELPGSRVIKVEEAGHQPAFHAPEKILKAVAAAWEMGGPEKTGAAGESRGGAA